MEMVPGGRYILGVQTNLDAYMPGRLQVGKEEAENRQLIADSTVREKTACGIRVYQAQSA